VIASSSSHRPTLIHTSLLLPPSAVNPTISPIKQQDINPTITPSDPSRKIGTAADDKWLDYDAPKCQPPQAASRHSKPSPARLVILSKEEIMNFTIRTTARLRVLIAAVIGILIAISWDSHEMLEKPKLKPSVALYKSFQHFGNQRYQLSWRYAQAGVYSASHGAINWVEDSWAAGWSPLPLYMFCDVAVLFTLATIVSWMHALGLVRLKSNLRGDNGTGTGEGPMSMIFKMVPGSKEKYQRLAAWQKLMTTVLDDVAVVCVSMVMFHVLPMMMKHQQHVHVQQMQEGEYVM